MSVTKEKLIIGICDDEPADLKWVQETLEELINKHQLPQHWEIYTYTTGDALLEASKEIVFRLLFLDIEMPEYSGFELARKIQMRHPYTSIAFVSNHENLVYESFQYAPLQFVRKNCLYSDLEKALLKYINSSVKKTVNYKFSDKRSTRSVPLIDICYLECNAHNITIVTKEQIYHTHGSLKTFEKELVPNDFVRVHRNYLLNTRYIGHVLSREIELYDGTKIPMGRGRKKMIQEIVSTYNRMLL